MSLCVTAGDEGICVSCLAALTVTHGVQGTAMCASSDTWGTMGTPRLLSGDGALWWRGKGRGQTV